MLVVGWELVEFGVGYSFGIDIYFFDVHARHELATDRFFVIAINFWTYQLELFLEDKKPANVGVRVE